MAEGEAEEANSLEQLKRSMQYALIKNCDMNEEMRSDAVDLVISATEKYQANYELAARMVKDQVSRRRLHRWQKALAACYASCARSESAAPFARTRCTRAPLLFAC